MMMMIEEINSSPMTHIWGEGMVAICFHHGGHEMALLIVVPMFGYEENLIRGGFGTRCFQVQ